MPAALPLQIRPMRRADLAFALQCTQGEEWASEDAAMLEGFYLHYPAGCLIAELSGQPAGICIATPYGDSGFIGELIVSPQFRGHGIGAALLNHAVVILRQAGAQTTYLDGVVKAVPLYERNGFRIQCRSLRLSGRPPARAHPEVRLLRADDLPAVAALDRRYFGADRGFFLKRRFELFPELGKALVEGGCLVGYLLGRRGQGWAAAGPMVIDEGVPDPQRLLEAFALEVGEDPISIGVLENNPQAVTLLRSLGFVERPDSPWRMALGPARDLGTSPQCYAVGSAAKG